VSRYRFAKPSPHIPAKTVASYTGTHSAGTRSSKTTVPGTVRFVAHAGIGENGTAQNATSVPTASRFRVKTAVRSSEDSIIFPIPGLIEMLRLNLFAGSRNYCEIEGNVGIKKKAFLMKYRRVFSQIIPLYGCA